MLEKVKRAIFGRPKDVRDPHAFHKLSLVALLAWVGLGADGLSSSAYGPDEAFRQLGEHTGLAVLPRARDGADGLHHQLRLQPHHRALSFGRRRVRRRDAAPRHQVGVVSGAALLVDYVLTITISIASGADAIFSFFRRTGPPGKLTGRVRGARCC